MAHEYTVTIVIKSKHCASGKHVITHVSDCEHPLSREQLLNVTSMMLIRAFMCSCEHADSITIQERAEGEEYWREVDQNFLSEIVAMGERATQIETGVKLN